MPLLWGFYLRNRNITIKEHIYKDIKVTLFAVAKMLVKNPVCSSVGRLLAYLWNIYTMD